jgi:NADPH:quinone reductase-like Zn-dependent oxidoreductase
VKAITACGYGAAEQVLDLVEVEDPEVGEEEVLVQVHAASVNAADWHLLRGAPYAARLKFGLRKPNFRIPGSDFAGTVLAVGSHVTGVEPGADVYGTTFLRGFGAFADLVAAPAAAVAPKPAGLAFTGAAAVPLAGCTALQALRDHGRLSAGQHVLIVGASGGVGSFAVQIAKALGAEVTGVCSTRNTELVRSLGADHVVDHTTTDFTRGAGRFDLIVQAAGTQGPWACRRALRPRGALVQVSGDSNHRFIGPLGRIAGAAVLSPFVPQRMTSFTVDPNRHDLLALDRLIEAGVLTPLIDRTYPIEATAAAVRHVEDGHTRGKTVIAITPAATCPAATTQHTTHRS